MKNYLMIACLFLITLGHAQTPNTKWGKPSQIEWDLQAWGEAPDAEALVLNRTMQVSYEISNQFMPYNNMNTELSLSSIANLGTNDNKFMSVTYENKLRIKILKDTGASYANLDILYLDDAEDPRLVDELARVKVTVFSKNEKGKVSRRMIKSENFKNDRINEHYSAFQIRIPDVKAGDIIEYQYTVTSTRVTFLYDCSFQEEIPVLYAKCDMDIPALLQFDMKVPIHPFIKSKVEQGVVRATQATADMQAPKSYPSNHYIIEGHDILPKGLDLQRNDPSVDKAKVNTTPGRIMKTYAFIKNNQNAAISLIPEGKSHLMINPE